MPVSQISGPGLQTIHANRLEAAAPRAKPEETPFEAFEAFVLQSFVASMLPSENTAFFGTGTAGGVWKSMLARQIGAEIAAAGGIGIADYLAEAMPDDPAKASTPAAKKTDI